MSFYTTMTESILTGNITTVLRQQSLVEGHKVPAGHLHHVVQEQVVQSIYSRRCRIYIKWHNHMARTDKLRSNIFSPSHERHHNHQLLLAPLHISIV